jgi:tetratricopeptide (TPR) repeat protein
MPSIRPATGLECSAAPSDTRSSQSTQSIATTHPALDQLLRWLDAVETHAPGCSDAAVLEVSRWSPADFETLLGNLANIAAFHMWIRQTPLDSATNARSSIESLTGTGRRVSEARFIRDRDRIGAIVIQNRRFSSEDLEKIFKGNDTLRRGALLHADIAVFVPGHFRQYPTVNDGHRQSGRLGTFHWQIGRQLLDMVSPGPNDDSGSRLWYRAVTAHLFHRGNLAEVAQHLQKARQVFAGDRQVLLDSACLHLELSSPAVQAAVAELRAERAETAVETRRAELQIAERFLRETLAVAPRDAEAHYRLGYILGELGLHAAALTELRAAMDAQPDPEQRYLTELFLGREQQTLEHIDEAKRHYETAAALFPEAQSPQIALAFLARVSGDRVGALDALRSITERSAGERADPWHTFYKAHWADAEPLMREMREQLGGAR